MNCNHDIPISAACIIRELELRGWEFTQGQNLEMDNWQHILFTVVPELRTMCGFQQNNPYHVYDVWQHTAAALRAAGDDPVVALTILFHDIGKPECYTEDEDGRGHFYGHGPVSARITKQVMKRLKFDEETIDTVVELVRYHDSDLHEKRRSIRTWLDRLGEKQFRRLLEVRRCEVSGQNPACLAERLARIHRLEALLDEVVEQTGQFYIKDLDINGSDLIQIGYTPGSSIGSTLSKLADQVVEGVMENKRDILLREAGRWLIRE